MQLEELEIPNDSQQDLEDQVENTSQSAIETKVEVTQTVRPKPEPLVDNDDKTEPRIDSD